MARLFRCCFAASHSAPGVHVAAAQTAHIPVSNPCPVTPVRHFFAEASAVPPTPLDRLAMPRIQEEGEDLDGDPGDALVRCPDTVVTASPATRPRFRGGLDVDQGLSLSCCSVAQRLEFSGTESVPASPIASSDAMRCGMERLVPPLPSPGVQMVQVESANTASASGSSSMPSTAAPVPPTSPLDGATPAHKRRRRRRISLLDDDERLVVFLRPKSSGGAVDSSGGFGRDGCSGEQAVRVHQTGTMLPVDSNASENNGGRHLAL